MNKRNSNPGITEKDRTLTDLLIHHRYILLTILCGLLYLSNLGGYRFINVDEPRYASTARNMIETGDYVIPVFNGKYRFEKPVLTYWLIAGGYRLFGVSEFSARFPSALAGLATVLLTCLLAGRLLGPGTGLTAGAVLACCIQFIALGRWAITDMHLCFFITGCLVFFYLAYTAGDHTRGRLYLIGAFAFSALAALTKGPVGLVLPGVIIASFIFLRRKQQASIKFSPASWAAGIAVFLAITLPWYILVTLRSDLEFFRVFFLQHNLQRFFGEVSPGAQHVEPFYYYIPAVLLGIFPWSFFAVQAVFSPMRRLFTRIKEHDALRVDSTAFLLLWTLLVILFFSLSRAKVATYITPAFPPLAILIADYWAGIVADKSLSKRPLSLLVPAGIGLVLALIGAVYILIHGHRLASFSVGNLPLTASAFFLLGPLGSFLFLLSRRLKEAFSIQVAGQAMLAGLIVFSIFPMVSEHNLEPQIRLLEKARELTGDQGGAGGKLAAYRYNKTSLPYYYGRKVLFLGWDQRAALDTLPQFFLIVREKHLKELASCAPSLKLLSREKDILLLLGRKE